MLDRGFPLAVSVLLSDVLPLRYSLALLLLLYSQAHHASAIRVDSKSSLRSLDSHPLFFAGNPVGSPTSRDTNASSVPRSSPRYDYHDDTIRNLNTSFRQEASEIPNGNRSEPKCLQELACETWVDKRGNCVARYVLLFDLWERLVNMRTAFANIAMMGKDSGFSVVVPFVFGCKVNMNHFLPHHYLNKSNPVLTLADYFSYDAMQRIGNVVPFSKWAEVSGKFVGGQYWKVASIISAVVYIDWESPYDESSTVDFQWCRDRDTPAYHRTYYFLVGQKKHLLYTELAPDVLYERRLCIHGQQIRRMSPTAAADYWQRLFQFVESSVKVKKPITLAFQNFRKHGWRQYTDFLRNQREYEDVQSSVVLADGILERAIGTAHSKFGDSKYIAVHFRAGRTMDLLNKVNNGTVLAEWGAECVDRLVTEILNVKQSGLGALPVFLATDLLNNGMLGGESPRSTIMHRGLSQVKNYLLDKLKDAKTIDESDVLPLSQYDIMGMASLLDMAMCIQADIFVSMNDSFSNFVGSERRRLGRLSHIVQCVSFEPS